MGEYIGRFFLCGRMYFAIFRPFQPGETLGVKGLNGRDFTMFGEVLLDEFDDRFAPSFTFGVCTPADVDLESRLLSVAFKVLGVNNVSKVLPDDEQSVLVEYDLLRYASIVIEGHFMECDEISCRGRPVIPSDVFVS